MQHSEWNEFISENVVIDTSTNFVFIGKLTAVQDYFVVLETVDVHDCRESSSTREKYVMDVKKFGIKPNRKKVSVRKELIVSISKLDDIIEY